jgi:hypothetical protein
VSLKRRKERGNRKRNQKEEPKRGTRKKNQKEEPERGTRKKIQNMAELELNIIFGFTRSK